MYVCVAVYYMLHAVELENKSEIKLRTKREACSSRALGSIQYIYIYIYRVIPVRCLCVCLRVFFKCYLVLLVVVLDL